MKEEKLIIVYNRVSSANQSLELQNSAAQRYLKSEGYRGDEEYITYLNDHDVSALKLHMSKREKLMELIRLIQSNKVDSVIFYKRDRIYRNFYEGADITKIFIEHGVNVVFTASDEPPFSNKLALEAFYAIFGQMEGENIRTRTADARKQFPTNIYGYKRKKDQDQVTFIIDQQKRDHIRSLFIDFSSVQNEDGFFNLLVQHKKVIKNPERILKILSNPFYTAHLETKNGFQELAHVEPIVTLETFLAARKQLDVFYDKYQIKILELSKQRMIIPFCGSCGKQMKHKKQELFDIGYYVCSSNHRRVSINVEEVNQIVKQTVEENAKTITPTVAKRLIIDGIKKQENSLSRNLENISEDYLKYSLKLCTLGLDNKSLMDPLIDKITILKDKYKQLSHDQSRLEALKHDTKEVNSLLSKMDVTFSEQDFIKLVELLVDKVTIHENYVSVDLFLSKFMKDVSGS
ncbi:recombinase family protein [Evansella halocellulosilytica]|uniref:recombinase family protein n=1 Tax=Evansella halocellulosilytica TaxID=2011013 RepID=UPI0015C96A01|nr:recombinase family protein [Evansella halocellulosilytica]